MNEIQQKLPVEIADVFVELDQHISWLHAIWRIYEQLFATDEKRVELLNDFAPVFFALCQDSFIDNITLAISRLIDHQKSAGKDTLSLDQLISKIDPLKHPVLRNTLNQELTALKDSCQSIRVIRNRKLAHNDLHVALDISSNPLPEIRKKDYDRLLQQIRELMNTIWTYFVPDSEWGYDVLLTNDGETLIRAIEKAKRYDTITRQKRQNL